ncbi:MAG TPA: hydroxysqualene dehydroxylase HpnE [Bryobacteraceae bacterium]|nr:hydroxysqualene dehydroxylase HpnE [Bryobacteraceae bacterium]
MPTAIVIGGGLAGLAAAAALGGAGFQVDLFESRGFLGGRATSYPVPGGEDAGEVIDNCQHVLLRCCVNLLDFYGRLGVADRIHFHKKFYFLEPGGRTSVLEAGALPAPLHFTGSFAKLSFLGPADKIAVARGLLALRRERERRGDLDRISMLDWLREKRQTKRAIGRFWSQVLVSAINEDLDRMAASHGFQVFWLGFLARSDSYQMGIPAVPLGDLYGAEAWTRIGNVRLHLRAPVERLIVENGAIRAVASQGVARTADYYVSALPFERLPAVAPELALNLDGFEHSPITGIHLWFDRSLTGMPHATLLDRTIQWMFNKSEGRYLQLVVSASRSLLEMPRADVIALALKELAEFFPQVKDAQLEKAHVVKEVRATFSAQAGLEQKRPGSATLFPNFFLAGDWTRSGWPATMEGAVRSGYLAAEAVARAAGEAQQFLLPDIA